MLRKLLKVNKSFLPNREVAIKNRAAGTQSAKIQGIPSKYTEIIPKNRSAVLAEVKKEDETNWVEFLKALEIPKEKVSAADVQKKCKKLEERYQKMSDNFLGYQAAQDLPPIDQISWLLEMHMNNAGDPFIYGPSANNKEVEVAVMSWYARLWNDKYRDELNPTDGENFWGYVLNMGSTEGNLTALWNAREYFKITKENGNFEQRGKEPICLWSDQGHYSLGKAAGILGLQVEHIEAEYQGRVIVPKLLDAVTKYAKEGRPVIVVLNMGTTFTGAFDDHKCIDKIHQICNEHAGLDKDNKQIRSCWIHQDGALGGNIAPFMQHAYKNMENHVSLEIAHEMNIDDQDIPRVGFNLTEESQGVMSINASFYKYFGAPYPCGVFMTQNKYLMAADVPDYIGSPDTTLGGGRNSFSPMYIWWRLMTTDYDAEGLSTVDSLKKARRLVSHLKEIDNERQLKQKEKIEHPLDPKRAPYSFGIRFRYYEETAYINGDFSIPQETRIENGETAEWSHIYCMRSTNKDLFHEFVNKLRKHYDLKPVTEHEYNNVQ